LSTTPRLDVSLPGGNAELMSASPGELRVRIRADADGEHFQWFCFRVLSEAPVRVVIDNARYASYAEGWFGYAALTQTAAGPWTHAVTRYRESELVFEHPGGSAARTYALFAPYDPDRRAALLERAAAHAVVDRVARSVEGRPIHRVRLGTGVPVWILCRQHAGESMSEWWAEGLVERLADDADPVSRRLLQRACVHVVPCLNPDGAAHGFLRTNAAGVNLHACWAAPDAARSPEVAGVRAAMELSGCVLALDVHGDELEAAPFLIGTEGVPGWNASSARSLRTLRHAYAQVAPEVSTQALVPADERDEATLRLCADWVAHRFGCLAATLELPFKGPAGHPERAKALGAAAVDALVAALDA
jgi:murein tripeptide amidase MpaA